MTITKKNGYRSDVEIERNESGISAKRTFYLHTTDRSDDVELRILDYPDLPQFGDSLSPDYSNVTVYRVRPKTEDFVNWEVEVFYKTPDSTSGGGVASEKINERANVRMYANRHEYILQQALDDPSDPTFIYHNGVPQNTAGDLFDPGIVVDEVRPVVSVQQNMPSFDGNYLKYIDTVNLNSLKIGGLSLAPGEGLMIDMSVETFEDSLGEIYYSVSYAVEFREGGHKKLVINAGFQQKDTSTFPESKKKITYGDIGQTDEAIKDEPIDEPAYLSNATGQVLADQSTGPEYLNFKIYKDSLWSGLDIPPTLEGFRQ